MSARVPRKRLEILLSQLQGFSDPSPKKEQYEISDSVAATMLFTAATHGDIEDKRVFDLGCGPGRLAIGAALLGAVSVTGFDIDSKVLNVAEQNAIKLGVNERIEFVAQAIETIVAKADTVLMNAPFGVQQVHADQPFLQKALETGDVVYSLHKASSGGRKFIARFVSEFGGRISFVQELPMALPATMKFHEKKRHIIKVDFYRIEKQDVSK
ncbi:MAG: METTL5 family protein [Candidatus Thorarchaeota archaeon]